MHTKYNCPVELALDQLSAKWKTVLLAHLKQGPMRYSELRTRVPKMSEKMLTQRLRELVEIGFLEHEGNLYRLSAKGQRLRHVLDALYQWGRSIADEEGIEIGS